MEVHSALGMGFKEVLYQDALEYNSEKITSATGGRKDL